MFRTVPLSIIRSLAQYTQHNLYDLYLLLCTQYLILDDGQRNCPKHVEFYSKNKFEKLVHLVGFNIRLYHHARSPERQTIRYFPRQLKPLHRTANLYTMHFIYLFNKYRY